MGSLPELLREMGEQNWLVTVVLTATVTATVTVIVTKPGEIVRLLLWVGRTIKHKFQQFKTNCQVRRTQGIVERLFQRHPDFHMPIEYYNSSLRMVPNAAKRQLVEGLQIDEPKWLNDYFVATALETLLAKRKIGRAIMFSRLSWPPRAEWYLFLPHKPGTSLDDQVKEIETNSKCSIYQYSPRLCPLEDRFDWQNLTVLESAPPCQRCWEQEYGRHR